MPENEGVRPSVRNNILPRSDKKTPIWRRVGTGLRHPQNFHIFAQARRVIPLQLSTMLYDLNVPWSSTNTAGLQRTISFLCERESSTISFIRKLVLLNFTVNYSVIALNHTINSAIPSQVINPIPTTLTFPTPKNLKVLRRCTLIVSDPSLNHRLPALAQAYDILALRPTTSTAFQAACATLDHHSIISLDLSVRYPFHFRPTPLMTAIRRGIKFEICYSQALQDLGSGGSSEKRRNFISNVLAIVRATRGRGLVVSSEARSVLGVRAAADVGNLMGIWGVSRERAVEATTINPRSVVVNDGINRSGFRGIIDVIEGGQRTPNKDTVASKADKVAGKGNSNGKGGKRKVDDSEKDSAVETPKISKRQEKKMRLAALKADKDASLSVQPDTKGETRDTLGSTNTQFNAS